MNSQSPNCRELHVFDPIHNGADECECGLLVDAPIHESDEGYEERMRPRIINAPERIWLQTGCDNEVGEINWKELFHADVSWCNERIDNTDIEYVRADLLTAIRKEERKAAFKEAVEAINAVPMSRYWSDSGEEIAKSFRAQAVRRIEAAATPAPKEEDEGLIALLLNWRKWYAEDMFLPWTIEEAKRVHEQFPSAVDRISADSARGTIDNIIKDVRAGKHRTPLISDCDPDD